MFATNKIVTIATFSAIIFVVIAYANKIVSIVLSLVVLSFKKWKTLKD